MVSYIEAKGLNKSFGKVIANEDVNLIINGGEIHALLGGKWCRKEYTYEHAIWNLYSRQRFYLYSRQKY